METIIAFSAAILFTLGFQTLHWLVRRSQVGSPGWGNWFVSADAWMAGWPIALTVGGYVVIYVLLQAARS